MATTITTQQPASLLKQCIKKISLNLHLYSCLQNLPEFVKDEIIALFQTYYETKNFIVNSDNIVEYITLLQDQKYEQAHPNNIDTGTHNGIDASIMNSTALSTLNLCYSHKLTNDGLTKLSTTVYQNYQQNYFLLMHLKTVDLSFCEHIGDSGIIAIVDTCRLLSHLNLTNCNQITDKGCERISRKCKFLESLSLELCMKITDIGIQQVARSKVPLSELNIGSCWKISNIGMQIIADHCFKTLLSLNLGGCTLMDFDVCDLSKKCIFLEHFILRACTALTDTSLKALGGLARRKRKKHLYGLKLLDIGGCSRFTDNGFNLMFNGGCKQKAEVDGQSPKYWRDLETLEMRGLHQITDSTVKLICYECLESGGNKKGDKEDTAFKLKTLTLQRCKNITDKGIDRLKQYASLKIIL